LRREPVRHSDAPRSARDTSSAHGIVGIGSPMLAINSSDRWD
jgi:hypothetical protein